MQNKVLISKFLSLLLAIAICFSLTSCFSFYPPLPDDDNDINDIPPFSDEQEETTFPELDINNLPY